MIEATVVAANAANRIPWNISPATGFLNAVDCLNIPTAACAASTIIFAIATPLESSNKPPNAPCIASTLPFISATWASFLSLAICLDTSAWAFSISVVLSALACSNAVVSWPNFLASAINPSYNSLDFWISNAFFWSSVVAVASATDALNVLRASSYAK